MIVLLEDVILVPGQEMTVTNNQLDWFYSSLTVDKFGSVESASYVNYNLTYDENFDYFTIRNISKAPRSVTLKLYWEDDKDESDTNQL